MSLPVSNPERTKSRLLEVLKQRQCSTAGALAEALGVTVPAARRHLQDLLDAGLIVAGTEKPGGRGRPQIVYRLSEQGEATFPKRYATLCVDVLRHVQALFGEGAVLRVMDARRLELAGRWQPQLTGSLKERLTRLAALLSEAGYAASVEAEEGALYLVQRNCPSPRVASEFDEVCQAELLLYSELLGVPVRRETRIASGAPTCRYRVGAPPGAGGSV